MKRYFRILLMIFIAGSTTLAAQSDSLIVQWNNESIKFPIFYQYEKPVEGGKYIAYYQFDSNRKAIEASYYLGKQSGVTKTFYPNGQIMESIVYQNGKRNGDYTFYDTTGLIQIKARYRNELLHGFYIDREQSFQGRFKDNLRNGKWEFEVGSPNYFKKYYRKGIEVEKRQIFPKLSSRKKEIKLEKEERVNPSMDSIQIPFNGKWSWYRLKYVPVESLSHPAMRKAYFVDFPTTVAHTKYVYNGYVNGMYKIYYPNGKLYRFLNYTAGYLDGSWKEFDQDGILRTKGKYRDGIKYGKWEYNLKTKNYKKELYRNGVKIK